MSSLLTVSLLTIRLEGHGCDFVPHSDFRHWKFVYYVGLSSVHQLFADCTVIQGVTIVRGKTVDHRTSNYFRAVATSMVGPLFGAPKRPTA